MISLDQVMLLEQKVESAVEKIQQLQAENDALRSKCSELTNALSSKSEQLSSFETDQSQIESGILKALDRLSAIENSVLKAAGQAASATQASVQQTVQIPDGQAPAQFASQAAAVAPNQEQVQPEPADFQDAREPQLQQVQDGFGDQAQAQGDFDSRLQPLQNETLFGNAQPVQENFFTMSDAPSAQAEEEPSDDEEPEEENPDNLGFDIF